MDQASTTAWASPPTTSRETARTASRAEYFPHFDWLRLVCALAVVLSHVHGVHLEIVGVLAVQIFFALSGWLIGGILLETRTHELPRFFFNRAVRIWVPYYLAIGVLIVFSALREPMTAKWIEFVVYKLLFVFNLFGEPQRFDHLDEMPEDGTMRFVWSVNAEEQFYLVAPWLLVIAARFGGRSIVTWAGIAALTWYFGSWSSIAFGVLAAVIVHHHGPVHLGLAPRIAFVLGIVFSIEALFLGVEHPVVEPILAISVVLLLAVPGRRQALGAIAGGISYPAYLNHWIGLYAANHIAFVRDDPLLNWLMASVVTTLIAYAHYHFIDRPLLASRSRWFTTARGYLATILAYTMMIGGISYGLMQLQAGP